MLTRLHSVNFERVVLFNQFQGPAWMSRLTSASFAWSGSANFGDEVVFEHIRYWTVVYRCSEFFWQVDLPILDALHH
jgi:hypothetical protein